MLFSGVTESRLGKCFYEAASECLEYDDILDDFDENESVVEGSGSGPDNTQLA